MSHETAREKLLDLAYGELPAREARRVEEHAAACAECGAALRRIRETRALMSALPPEPAPEAGERILLAAAREAARGRARPRRVLPPWLWGGSVAAVAAAAVVALSYRIHALRPGGLEREDPDALMGTAPASEAEVGARAEPRVRADAGANANGSANANGTANANGGANGSGNASGDANARVRADATAAAENSGRAEAKGSRLEDRSFLPHREVVPPSPSPAPPAEAEARDQPAFAEAPPPAAAGAGPAERPLADATPAAPAAIAPERAPARAAKRASAPDEFAAPTAAPARAPSPAHAPAAQAAAPAAAPERARAVVADDPVVRYQQLRAAGQLRGAIATFPDCDGEAWRKVEQDPEGRVVRYARHGTAGGIPFEAELYYAVDGALRVVRYREEGGAWREARLSGPGAAARLEGIPAAVVEPRRALDAGVEAPGRCR